VRRTARAAVHGLLAAAALPLLVLLAAGSRIGRRRRARPRIVWGPTPLISIRYWSEAVRRLGYESRTVVNGVYAINRRSDFDEVLERFRGPLRPLRPYLGFASSLRRFDVHCLFFDGSLLADTPLERLELPLLRLAGAKVVAMPYGSDVAVPGHLGPFEAAAAAFPALVARAPVVRRRVSSLARAADVVIRNVQPGYLPRHDLLWPSQLALDTAHWRPAGTAPSRADGRNGEVVVGHASNHRSYKGTEALVAAVERLRHDGLEVRLDLYEGRPNEEVRAGFERADVVVEQLLAGYGLTAVEAMSLGRPVLSRLSWLPRELREDPSVRACPIVDASVEDIADRLRELVTDPERRVELGARGREYVLRHHSYEAVGRVWDAVFRHVWNGEHLPARASDLLAPAVEAAPVETPATPR
jgi:glycosyltransferase involved in cell wall biosynthesis